MRTKRILMKYYIHKQAKLAERVIVLHLTVPDIYKHATNPGRIMVGWALPPRLMLRTGCSFAGRLCHRFLPNESTVTTTPFTA